MKQTNTEVTVIEKNLSPLAEKATNLQIKDDTTMKTGVELLSQLNQINDRITQEKDKVLKPLLEATKQERARWKPAEAQNQTAIDTIRAEMTRYQTAITKQKQIDEQKIASKVSSGYIKLDTAVTKIEALPEISKNIATDSGDVQFREKKQLLITNIDEIPREYMLPDEMALLRDLKAGKTIDGVTLETIQIPINYR